MNVSPNLTFKQQRFVEEYQVDSNGTQAVLRAGYQTKHPAEMAYGLLRNIKIKYTLQDAQNASRVRLHLQVGAAQQYIELKNRALKAYDNQTLLRSQNQSAKLPRVFEQYHATPLLEAMENNPEDFEKLAYQFL